MAVFNIFNIVGNVHGRWCAADTGAARLGRVPPVKMEEFQQNESAAKQAMTYWADIEKKMQGGSPYANLYLAKKTGNIYYLPFLENKTHHLIGQRWSAGAGPGYSNNLAIQWKLIAEQFQAPAAGVEQPHAWSGQDLATYSISFPLINTFKPDEDILKNYTFLRTIISRNLLSRPNPIHYFPPSLYTLSIPGIRYSPACVVTRLVVENVGAMHYHVLGGKNRTVPDAWQVTLTIKELILESREILAVGMGEAATGTVQAGLV